jgi:hypothetical protein
MPNRPRTRVLARAFAKSEAVWTALIAAGLLAAAAFATIPTTLQDFFLAGSQPNSLIDPVATAAECSVCHGGYDATNEPFRPWAASMMGQAARDPVFYAALAIANQDVAFAGDLCLRCHAPGGWIEGRSVPPDGSALTGIDFQGVSCNFCHRMVDPVYQPGNPIEDIDILASLGSIPPNPHSANFVMDPQDRRRGPFQILPQYTYHEWLQSPFHTRAQMCATCHDVSNPAYEKQPSGAYALGPLNQPHPTGSKYDQFPIERTYSEWAASEFAQHPVEMGGRFGGNITAVSSCQDCHMPQTTAKGCRQGEVRNNLPSHHFNGGNTWVLNAIRALYPDSETFLSAQSVADSIARATDMLQRASDLELSVVGTSLKTRITNQTGHKLPSGYPEGRRMWINVKFFDGQNTLIAERGAYDPATATLTTADTKVYEGKIGVDAAVSALTGIPVGPSFHFGANNLWYSDNRIPPRGFTRDGFAAVQAAPVNCYYQDGQYWDDTLFAIPPAAASAAVTVYYQSTSREYIEFLRDTNTTNSAGTVAYNQWVLNGKSAPVVMDYATIPLPCYVNCDGSTQQPVLNVNDFVCFQSRFAAADPWANCDGSTQQPVLNVNDFICFLQRFAAGCP